MITCREVIDFLDAHLDGTLAERERAVLAVHLGVCPECRNFVENYAATRRLARAACDEAAPENLPPLPDSLAQAILAARRGSA